MIEGLSTSSPLLRSLLAGALVLTLTGCPEDNGPGVGGGGTPGPMCDIWDADDCGSGQKCVGESVHDQPQCRSVGSNPDQVGDSCSNNGPGDTCDVGAMCIEGVCRQLCTGAPGNPSCAPLGTNFFCHIYENSGVPVCEEECDPLVAASCSGGLHCVPASFPSLERFTCGVDDSGGNGTLGDSCANQNQCAQGHVCVPESSLAGAAQCGGGTCCTELCELPDDENPENPCSTALHSCVPFYSGSPPPGLEHVGVCVIP